MVICIKLIFIWLTVALNFFLILPNVCTQIKIEVKACYVDLAEVHATCMHVNMRACNMFKVYEIYGKFSVSFCLITKKVGLSMILYWAVEIYINLVCPNEELVNNYLLWQEHTKKRFVSVGFNKHLIRASFWQTVLQTLEKFVKLLLRDIEPWLLLLELPLNVSDSTLEAIISEKFYCLKTLKWTTWQVIMYFPYSVSAQWSSDDVIGISCFPLRIQAFIKLIQIICVSNTKWK